jgi:hypothetical protein
MSTVHTKQCAGHTEPVSFHTITIIIHTMVVMFTHTRVLPRLQAQSFCKLGV